MQVSKSGGAEKPAKPYVKPNVKPTVTKRKPYAKPTGMKLTTEQAKLKLLGAACMGDQGAMDLLERLFR